MTYHDDPVSRFYLSHLLGGQWQDRGVYVAPCPFCLEKGHNPAGKLVVALNPQGFFHGYFRCLSRCTPGGFLLHFGSLLGLDPESVVGYEPDEEPVWFIDYPVANFNHEMHSCHEQLSQEQITSFNQIGVGAEVLAEMQIGFNGRYITYPYIQRDGNCYSLRCVYPDRPEDFFWHGDDTFSADPFRLFNVQEIERCSGGTLFLTEGEENLLVLRQLGYPGVAVPHSQVFENLEPELFQRIRTLFLLTRNCAESDSAARELAARIGFKVRMVRWPASTARNYSLTGLALDQEKGVRAAVGKLIRSSTAFSPFTTPDREYNHFLRQLAGRGETAYTELLTGFPLLDAALDGVHGINVIGGAPKVGKSAFVIQIASQMAESGIPVLYYDFENGRQQVYQRILSRLSRLETKKLSNTILAKPEQERYDAARATFRRMLDNFRVINDRKITPELMRRHIDFLRHETRKEYVVVVIDSLHKLPFKDLNERRTGIDAWLRELESIRDDMQVSFLVISELSRGAEKAYSERPHLGIFKGSGDIEYSADNAMVLYDDSAELRGAERRSTLWVVASREYSPGPVGSYRLDYPYWGFVEEKL